MLKQMQIELEALRQQHSAGIKGLCEPAHG